MTSKPKTRALALLLQRALGGMARLEGLFVLLGGAAVVVVFGCHGAAAAAAGLESIGNRRHLDCGVSESLRALRPSAGQNHLDFGRLSPSMRTTR